MRWAKRFIFLFIAISLMAVRSITAQPPDDHDKEKVRTVTVPISIFTKQELETKQAEEYVQAERLIVKEDKEEQTILSIRSVSNTPLELAVLIQEDLTSNFNLQIKDLAKFIANLPAGTRVFIGYIRGGSLVTRQKFTDDLERASKSLQAVSGSNLASGNGPYTGVTDALSRFEGLPSGRRAILLVSDGLDTQSSSPIGSIESIELDKAITKAQRRSVAVYSFFSPTAVTAGANSALAFSGQAGLQRLSDETGGRAFSQGTQAPVSFNPFFRELSLLLSRQFALTYLSTHMKKGYHRVDITSTNPAVKIEHPKGYFYR